MGRVTLLVAAAAALLAVPASASVSYYAKWDCTAPCVVTVDYGAMPASEQSLIQHAMDNWSNASIGFASAARAKVTLVPCEPNTIVKGTNMECGFFNVPKWTKNTDTLHSDTIYISSQWFGWDGMAHVYCDELGHALGLSDGAVEPDPNLPPDQTSTSCMAGSGSTPGIEDFALLAQMYR